MTATLLHRIMEAPEPGGDTMADRLFELLSEAIIGGEMAPGTRIREPELAAQYGTSRAPLREALRRLEERKLITRTPRMSARVTVVTPELIREIYAIREVLEGVAAREAANRVSDADIAHLCGLLVSHKAQFNGHNVDTYRMGSADDDFHFFIIRCSGNSALIHILCEEYYNLIRLFRRQHRLVGGRAQRAFIEHQRIADAIADRDGELAEILMRRHIAAALDGLLHAVSQTPIAVEVS
jgi:DNA-binding GntR family transcriptional regulator